jgi:hypothetical protein
MKSAIDGGVSPRSAHACASSAAILSLTSRDQPSAVLKATMRIGRHILALEQMADQRGAIGSGHVGCGAGQAEPAADVIEHEIDISTEGVGCNRR